MGLVSQTSCNGCREVMLEGQTLKGQLETIVGYFLYHTQEEQISINIKSEV